MTPLREEMIRQLQLQRLAPNTQQAYVRAVKGLAGHYDRSPDQISIREIRAYLHYLLVEREKEAYTEGTLLVLLSPTVYAVALWFAANWLIMGDPLFFFRGLTYERAAGVGWLELLLEACEWSFCLLPLLLALGAWLFTQMGKHVVVRALQGVAVVALAAGAMFVQVQAKHHVVLVGRTAPPEEPESPEKNPQQDGREKKSPNE